YSPHRDLHSFPTRRSSDLGTSPGSLSATALDERDSIVTKGKYNSHSIKLTKLQPQTQYYFEIVSAGEVLQNHGNPFTATTFATLDRKSTRLNSSHVKISYA